MSVAATHVQKFGVAIPSPLRSYTGGAARVNVTVMAATARLADVFAALDHMYPGIQFRMVDESGKVRPHIQIFVDGRVQRNLATPLAPGVDIMLVAALSGG